MNTRLLLRMMWRQTRGSRARALFFAACIACGVAALVAVGALVQAVDAGLAVRSRELLGGDLALESRRPLPDVDKYLRERGVWFDRVDVTVLPSMVQNDAGASRLVEIKAIDVRRGSYPLAGTLHVLPARPFAELLDANSLLASAPLAFELGLRVGDRVRIGGQPFVLRGVVAEQPDELQLSFAMLPQLLLTREGLARARLLGFGDRVRYRTLLALRAASPPGALARLQQRLAATVPGAGSFVEIETHEQAQPAVRNTLRMAQRYFGLTALLSLLLGCVGVAQLAALWVAQSARQTAVLRCLGVLPREVLLLHLGYALLLALAGSLAGGLLGLAAPWLIAQAFPALRAVLSADAVIMPAWLALAQGVAVGVCVAAVFCLPPLTAVYRVSPAQVLRSEAAPLPVPRAARWGALAACALGTFLAAYSQARQPWHALAFALGAGALGAALWLAAQALRQLAARLPRRRLPVVVWQGVAALARPGAGTLGSVVGLGFGTMLVLTIALVEGVVAREIERALPRDAPSVFLADVQPDQWPGIAALARGLGARRIENAPVVMARLSAIDGRPVAELVRERARDREGMRRASWVFTREQRVTWSQTLPGNNTVVAGALWSRPDVAEISLEQGFARDLEVGLGARLTFDVQGVPIELVVSSLRTVEWRSFSPNFFLVAEPGALDDAPQLQIGALRIEAASEQALQDQLAQRFPNVTVVRVRAFIERASAVLAQLATGVRLLGGFALLTGLCILISAVAAAQLQRAREAALLKTLGASRAWVITAFACEHALRGAAAGAIGAVFAYALATGFTRELLELQAWPSLGLCAFAVLATALLSIVGGLLASLPALAARPLRVLRGRG